MGKKVSDYTRSEIVSLLNGWFDCGVLSTPEKMRLNNNEIERLSNKKELSYTNVRKLIFVGDSSCDERFALINSLVVSNRIMPPLTAKVVKGIRTLYQLHTAALRGDILRFERDGIILYID